MPLLTPVLAPVIVGVGQGANPMQPFCLTFDPNIGFIAVVDRRSTYRPFDGPFDEFQAGISMLQDARQRPATGLVTNL